MTTEAERSRPAVPAVATTPKQQPSNSSPEREVAGLVARLLLHYWAGELSDAARRSMASDWLEDLAEFGPEIVAEACRRWRRSESRRPTIAAIRALCIEGRQEVREAETLRLAAPRPRYVRPVLSEEDRREARELSDRLARERGYEDFDAYIAAGGSVAELAGLPLAVKRGSVATREYNPTPEHMAASRRQLADMGYLPKEEDAA